MKKLLLLAAVSGLLAACTAENSGTSTTPGESAASTPASTATPDTKGLDTATQESAGAGDSPDDASLERIIAMPDNVRLPSGRWKAGTHYVPLVPAQNTSAEPGQVEVLEFMWLGCSHCADLEPTIVAWDKQKPEYVKFVQEHVMWGPVHREHGRLLYTLQALNRADLVPRAFNEIHQRQNMLVAVKGNAVDEAGTLSDQLAFAKANGVSEVDFKREYSGFAVSARLQKAEEMNRRYRIESVPVIIINGKYQTDLGMAGSKKDLLQLITDLAAVEKGR